MATVGSFDFNLSKIGNTMNNALDLGEKTTQGVADQGDLIGLAIGITIAIVLIAGAILLILGVPQKFITKIRTIGKN